MTKQEFMKLTNLVPTDALYETIEDAYYAAGNMDKQQFCDNWVKVGSNILTLTLLKRIKILEGMLDERFNELDVCREDRENIAEFLLGKSCVYHDTDLYNKAVSLIGKNEVVKRKCKMNLPLWEEDIDFIAKNL